MLFRIQNLQTMENLSLEQILANILNSEHKKALFLLQEVEAIQLNLA